MPGQTDTRDVEPELLDEDESGFQRIEDTLRSALGRLRHPIEGPSEGDDGSAVADAVAENPGIALLGAAAIGWFAGRVIRRILP